MPTKRNHESEEIVTTPSGARASACLDYTGIPKSALNALAERQMLGAKKHGRDNYRKGLGDPTYIRERLSHVIRHAFTLSAKLDGREPWNEDDDIGAILWGGMFLAEAREANPTVFGASTPSAEAAPAVIGNHVNLASGQPESKAVYFPDKRVEARKSYMGKARGEFPVYTVTDGRRSWTASLGARFKRAIDGTEVEFLGENSEGSYTFTDVSDGGPFWRRPWDVFDLQPA